MCLQSGRLKVEPDGLRFPFSIGFVDERNLIRGTSSRLCAKILASSRRPFRAPAARPKGANDEEVRESPGIVCGFGGLIGLRVARSRPLLRRRLPDLYDDQEHAAPERDDGERRTGEIKVEQERASSECETRADSDDSRPVVSFFGVRMITPRLRPQLPPRPRGAACAPRSLSPQFPPARNHSARIPSSSCRAPGSSKSVRSHS